MIAEINAWLAHEPNLWFLLGVALVGMFWTELVEEPLAKWRVRRSLNQWTIQELKDHLAQRNSDDSP